MVKIRLAAPLQTDSVVDGQGLRLVIWTQGCPHHCDGCHNKESHAYDGGKLYEIDELCQEINDLNYHDGITFSGGEPFEQVEECLLLAKYAKSLGLNVWCYTGYTWEFLQNKNSPIIQEFLNYIDILVDGKFDRNLKSLECKFRGSSNQRCIDVSETKKLEKICTLY